MTTRLFGQAILKFACGLILVGCLLFIPAGTLDYWQGWLFMAILFIPMFVAGLVLMKRAPDLLEKRLNARESQSSQALIIKLGGLMFIAGFIAAGLSARYGFLMFPDWVSWMGTVLFLAGYALYGEVLKENRWLSRTVEVQQGQKVVDTGLYGIVRHPMYMATILLFLSMPLVLGSALSFLIFLPYPLLIASRISNEEDVLEQGLDGYADYKHKVRYRIFPGIW